MTITDRRISLLLDLVDYLQAVKLVNVELAEGHCKLLGMIATVCDHYLLFWVKLKGLNYFISACQTNNLANYFALSTVSEIGRFCLQYLEWIRLSFQRFDNLEEKWKTPKCQNCSAICCESRLCTSAGCC